jgi:hypothetical protein
VKHGQENKLIDPSADKVYIQGKVLRQEKAPILQTNLTTVPNSVGCMKGESEIFYYN